MASFSEILRKDETSSRYLLESESYREFLKRFFEIKKRLNPGYSYNVFARSALLAKSLPRDIVEGERRLTEKSLPKFLRAMQLPGLVEEFFIKLVESETNPSSKNYLHKLAQMYIETSFTKSFTDQNFQDSAIPFIYAASGNVGVGSSLTEIAHRTGLPEEKIRGLIDKLEALELGRFDQKTDKFTPSVSQVHVNSGNENANFRSFYLYSLELVRASFTVAQKKGLFYSDVFSLNEKDLPRVKEELEKLLKSFVLKNENSTGDSVAVMNLGFFRQEF
ncbi:MAG TPA: TIGR02147 family protein [Bacteriovoracaceae bacterium]|nr:TIGR02147 family protein [Bacteriovoracaceae bacterium]